MLACRVPEISFCESSSVQRVCTPGQIRYAVPGMQNLHPPNEVTAAQFTGALDAGGFPAAHAWDQAQPVSFNSDWQGKNADPQLETEARLMWTPASLFLRFRCRYRTLTVFDDSAANGRRDHLWDRDVAEVFLQPDPSQPRRYWEFEIAPNGMWIDLDIFPGGKGDPQSGMISQVVRNANEKAWTAELALPMRLLVPHFNPSSDWRVNFFRVEGATEPRFYSAWQPTHTPQPNFHVPEAFGVLRFQSA